MNCCLDQKIRKISKATNELIVEKLSKKERKKERGGGIPGGKEAGRLNWGKEGRKRERMQVFSKSDKVGSLSHNTSTKLQLIQKNLVNSILCTHFSLLRSYIITVHLSQLMKQIGTLCLTKFHNLISISFYLVLSISRSYPGYHIILSWHAYWSTSL